MIDGTAGQPILLFLSRVQGLQEDEKAGYVYVNCLFIGGIPTFLFCLAIAIFIFRQAREQGVHLGQKKRLTRQQIAERRHRRAQGVLIKTLMREYHLSKASVYRYLGDMDSASSTQRGQTA